MTDREIKSQGKVLPSILKLFLYIVIYNLNITVYQKI